MHAHDVAAVATDNYTFEVVPCEVEEPFIPVHILHLVAMGLTQGQNWDLEALGAAAPTTATTPSCWTRPPSRSPAVWARPSTRW